MSNTLTTNPYIVTTAMGSSMKNSSGLPTNIPIYVTEIFWLSPATIGDTFTFKDGTGTVRRTGTCEVAGQSQLFPFVPPISISDFQVTQISSGTLYISTF